jgi:anaerobic magnesium-protoporphyrin IX monomethyl ester cyclase
MADAGLRFLSLPFESASQRILDRWASAKWQIAKTDVPALLRSLAQAGINASGNYMIGYPDETPDEMYKTIRMARLHVDAGLQYALFFTVVPFPGSALFETVISNGQLDRDFDTNRLRWTTSILRNTPVPSEALEYIRQVAWLTTNPREYVEYKLGMQVVEPK